LPVGRGRLAMRELRQIPVHLPNGRRRADPRQGIVQAKGLDVPAEGLPQIGDGCILGLTLAVGRNVGNASGVATLIGIGISSTVIMDLAPFLRRYCSTRGSADERCPSADVGRLSEKVSTHETGSEARRTQPCWIVRGDSELTTG